MFSGTRVPALEQPWLIFLL